MMAILLSTLVLVLAAAGAAAQETPRRTLVARGRNNARVAA